MFEDTNKQALVSFCIPPVHWLISITTTHYWHVNVTVTTIHIYMYMHIVLLAHVENNLVHILAL